MKKVWYILVFAIMHLFTSCFYFGNDDDGPFVESYTSYEPVRISRSEFENSITLEESKVIETSGKIYIKGNLLFINEVRKGFHIFDNTDPANPKPIKFLTVPGSTDLAIRNNTFYINQATDLISINFDSSLQEISVSKRIRDVFPVLISPDGFYPNNTSEDEVVVDWALQTKQL